MQIFEWDDAKAEANLAKHGVSFEVAMRVWEDPHHQCLYDSSENYDEDRYIVLGLVDERCLYVAYTQRGDQTRIISARIATSMERSKYHEG